MPLNPSGRDVIRFILRSRLTIFLSFEKLAGIVDNLFLLRLICVRLVRFPKLFGRLASLLLVITSDHESDERFPKLSGSVVRLLLRS